MYYPASLLRFANYHMEYLVKLENKIDNLINENLDCIEMPFIQD